MFSRRLCVVTLVLVVVGEAAPAIAGDNVVADFFCSIPRDTKRRNCWPQPFVRPDRQAVREPLAIMVCNGWQRQNMLSDHYFEAKTGLLTEAGRQRIQSILTETPQQHLAVFVHRGQTPEETMARLQTVQQVVAQAPYPSHPVPVFETAMPDDGWPAERVDMLGRRFQATTPDPKLPPKESSQGGSK